MPLSLDNPYLADGFEWVRGNLHTHTTRSDGQLPPEDTAKAYADLGYDFLCLSDHDCLTWPVAGPEGLVLIPGIEVGGGPHILAVNVEVPIEPAQPRQAVIEAIASAGGFAVLCHPNWEAHFDHFPLEAMAGLSGYTGVEIYNGVVDFLEGSALATDKWDQLLQRGIRAWGFAHDDAHHTFAYARAWIVAQVRERTRQAIVEALRAGRFYSSTGVQVTSIRTARDTVLVEAPDAQRIRFYGQWGRLVGETNRSQATYQVGGREGAYVRAECWGAGGRCAWTQPIFITSK